MRCVFVLALALLFPTSGFAENAVTSPTVTLTQSELQALIDAEATKAVTAYITQQEAAKAKDAYAKIQAAFAPKPTPK